ncbi:enoyl-CoA hydratase 1-like protein [Salinisphaera dokdonensis CL-ES53]|uniref:Enoyl-CoA hydratase 1-like protein n=2 Tax=Salinisphaera TaxID=180541 RepID=A0ABV2B249_9GAMM
MEALEAFVGQEVGVSDWLTIDQERINTFADATEDHQWIHVDVERAKRESPFGGPIAHGFLTLSLLPQLTSQIKRIEGVTTTVNYGLDKVRFIAPVPVDARVRARQKLEAIEPRGDNRYMLRNTVTIEIEGGDKPACIAESLSLIVF